MILRGYEIKLKAIKDLSLRELLFQENDVSSGLKRNLVKSKVQAIKWKNKKFYIYFEANRDWCNKDIITDDLSVIVAELI